MGRAERDPSRRVVAAMVATAAALLALVVLVTALLRGGPGDPPGGPPGAAGGPWIAAPADLSGAGRAAEDSPARAADGREGALPLGREAASAPTGAASWRTWRGRVVELGSERAVAGARVRLEGEDSALRAEAGTDEGGAFELLWPEGARARIEIAHPDYLELRRPRADLDSEAAPFELSLAAGIRGRILVSGAPPPEAAEGQPEAAVYLRRRGPGPEGEEVRLVAHPGADGRFEFPHLWPGEYALAARAPTGGVTAQAGLLLAKGERLEVDLEVGPQCLVEGSVRWHDSHEAVEGAVVRAEPMVARVDPEALELLSSEAATDALGRYRLEGLGTGEYRLTARTPWGAEFDSRVHLSGRGERIEHDFRVGGLASVEGAVIDPLGGAVPGARVVVLRQVEEAPPPEVLIEGEAAIQEGGAGRAIEADAAGGFLLADLLPYEQLVLVALPPPDRAGELTPSRGLSLQLRPEQERSGVRLQLSGGAQLTGLVRAEHGQPVEGARISLVYPTRVGDLSGPSALTDREGAFALEGLPPGGARLEVEAEGYATARRKARLAAGEPAWIELELEPALPLEGVAVDERGFAVGGAVIRLILQDPGGARESVLRAVTGPFGDFRFDSLPTGRWSVETRAAQWELGHCDPGEVLAPEHRWLTVVLVDRELAARASMVGLVVVGKERDEPQGLRLEGLRDGLVEVDRGRFEITGLRPRRTKLVARAQGCVPVRIGPVDLRAGTRVDLGQIQLERGTEVLVRVRDAAGRAVRGAKAVLLPRPARRGGVGRAPVVNLREQKGGRYASGIVRPGKWELRVAAEGCEPHRGEVRIRQRERQRIDVPLKRAK